MSGKRSAHKRFPEVLDAAVRVFARDGFRSARMSDVAREAGLSEAALYRYVDGKEGLFVLAIRHALLLEPLPAEDDLGGGFPLTAPSLEEIIREAREYVAAEFPFGTLAQAMLAEPQDPAAELEAILRELFSLEELTNRAADMIERSARELPELADLLNAGLRPSPRGTDQLPGQSRRHRRTARDTGQRGNRAPGPGDADVVRPAPLL